MCKEHDMVDAKVIVRKADGTECELDGKICGSDILIPAGALAPGDTLTAAWAFVPAKEE